MAKKLQDADPSPVPKNPSTKKSTTPSWTLQLPSLTKYNKKSVSSNSEWATQVELMNSCWTKANTHHEPWLPAAKETSAQDQPVALTKQRIKKRSISHFKKESVACPLTNIVHANSTTKAKASQSSMKDFSITTVRNSQTLYTQETSKSTWKGILTSLIKISIVIHFLI